MSLSPDRLERFARTIIVPEIGGAGQVALAKAHVTLVGLGGIGSPVLQYLAGAGIGHLRLIDDGDVELSNVGAVILPSSMPYVLLGNSWLSRFQMRRENDVMRLELR